MFAKVHNTNIYYLSLINTKAFNVFELNTLIYSKICYVKFKSNIFKINYFKIDIRTSRRSQVRLRFKRQVGHLQQNKI